MARSRPPAARPPFDVRHRGGSTEDLKAVEKRWQPAIKQHLLDLAARGCAAAGYALSGPPPWPALCSTHIGPYRVIVSFPAEGVVAIMKVAKHDAHIDPYAELATEIGLEVPSAPRTKPPCCDGAPPIDEELAGRLDEHFAQLTRSQRQRASRRK